MRIQQVRLTLVSRIRRRQEPNLKQEVYLSISQTARQTGVYLSICDKSGSALEFHTCTELWTNQKCKHDTSQPGRTNLQTCRSSRTHLRHKVELSMDPALGWSSENNPLRVPRSGLLKLPRPCSSQSSQPPEADPSHASQQQHVVDPRANA